MSPLLSDSPSALDAARPETGALEDRKRLSSTLFGSAWISVVAASQDKASRRGQGSPALIERVAWRRRSSLRPAWRLPVAALAPRSARRRRQRGERGVCSDESHSYRLQKRMRAHEVVVSVAVVADAVWLHRRRPSGDRRSRFALKRRDDAYDVVTSSAPLSSFAASLSFRDFCWDLQCGLFQSSRGWKRSLKSRYVAKVRKSRLLRFVEIWDFFFHLWEGSQHSSSRRF